MQEGTRSCTRCSSGREGGVAARRRSATCSCIRRRCAGLGGSAGHDDQPAARSASSTAATSRPPTSATATTGSRARLHRLLPLVALAVFVWAASPAARGGRRWDRALGDRLAVEAAHVLADAGTCWCSLIAAAVGRRLTIRPVDDEPLPRSRRGAVLADGGGLRRRCSCRSPPRTLVGLEARRAEEQKQQLRNSAATGRSARPPPAAGSDEGPAVRAAARGDPRQPGDAAPAAQRRGAAGAQPVQRRRHHPRRAFVPGARDLAGRRRALLRTRRDGHGSLREHRRASPPRPS